MYIVGIAYCILGDGSGDKLMYTECGTPGYMAPEMFERKRGYDAQGADVWACGVILFIMVAGCKYSITSL